MPKYDQINQITSILITQHQLFPFLITFPFQAKQPDK